MATVENPATPKLHPRACSPCYALAKAQAFSYASFIRSLALFPLARFSSNTLLSNFEALKGPAAYAAQVKFLNSLPLVRVLEWVFIFLPILYHGLYGVYIWLRGKSNIVYYPWAGNWMYLAQRYTGIIAFLYILQHVLRQRFMGADLPNHPGMAFAKVQHELANPLMLAVYVIAMIAICWHFAYGIWLFAAKWGITPGEVARKRFGYVCAAIGVLLCVLGIASIWAFVEPKYQNAPEDVPPAIILSTAPITFLHLIPRFPWSTADSNTLPHRLESLLRKSCTRIPPPGWQRLRACAEEIQHRARTARARQGSCFTAQRMCLLRPIPSQYDAAQTGDPRSQTRSARDMARSRHLLPARMRGA